MRFLEEKPATLWSDAGERAWASRHTRGLTDETLLATYLPLGG